MNRRILPIKRIPADLWNRDTIQMPGCLKDIYVREVDRLHLRDRCLTRHEGKIYGGNTVEETHEHFATRFTVSVSRVQFSILAPTRNFYPASDGLLSCFSAGEIALLDIPSGTGAMSLGLISTLIHLRAERLLPRLPLRIVLCAGDYSVPALTIFESMLGDLVRHASVQGISVIYRTQEWDATRPDHTARLMDTWLHLAPQAAEYVVAVTDFSGALKDPTLSACFDRCLESIVARLYERQVQVIWIEPGRTSEGKRRLDRVKDFIGSLFWFGGERSSNPERPAAEYRVQHPLAASDFPSGVTLERYERRVSRP